MTEKLTNFLKENTLLDFGFCPFSMVEKSLLNCRKKNKIPVCAKTVICFLFPYKCNTEKPSNISRYAAVTDYHIIAQKKLDELCLKLSNKFKGFSFEAFTDNSPIPEVKAAALSGLGVIGKNKLLISKKWGSFVFLGEIITDMEIKFPPVKIENCIGCGKCIEICPTKFLKDEKNQCLSNITQMKKVEKEEVEKIKNGGLVFGCDKCQEVCPLNKDKPLTNIKEFLESYREKYELGEDNKNRAYNWRGEEIIKRNYKIINDEN